MIVEKKIDGEGHVTILVNGEPISHIVSRQLCGYTTCTNNIFSYDKAVLYYGDFRSEFNFSRPFCLTLPVQYLADIIMERITLVKKWIEDCKKTGGVVEIVKKEEIVKKFEEKEKDIFYRNKKGQITKLDI